MLEEYEGASGLVQIYADEAALLAAYERTEEQSRRLYLSASSLPTAGLGLFAKDDIPKDTLVTIYGGPVVTRKEALKLSVEELSHARAIMRHLTFLGEKDMSKVLPTHLGHMLNDSVDLEISKFRSIKRRVEPNVAFVTAKIKALDKPVPDLKVTDVHSKITIFVKTIADVQAGNELLISYGDEYWNRLLR
jgi:SET domain-containing protein